MADTSIKDVIPSSANLDDKIPTSQAADPTVPSVITPAGIIALHSGTNTHSQIDTALTRLANTSGTNTGDSPTASTSILGVVKVDGTTITIDGGGIISSTGGGGSGNVVGPSSATDSDLVAFDTTTGKLIKDSGKKISDFATALQGTKADTAVQQTTTVNGHALSSNVIISASDLTTGTLPHAQLPTLLSGDIPNNAANTTGNATTATNIDGGNSTTLLGSIPYQSDTNTTTLLNPNTTVTQKFLSQTGTGTNGAAPTWATLPISGLATYMFDTPASDIATYLQMKSLSNYTPATVSTVTTSITTSGQLVATWVTNAGFPGLTLIPDGIFHLHIHASRNTGTLSIQPFIYKRTSGGTETLIATGESTPNLLGTETEYDLDALLTQPVTLTLTDRIVVKWVATTTGGTHNVILAYQGNGSTGLDPTYSRIEMPVPAVDTSTFVPYTGATTDLVLGTHAATGASFNSITALASSTSPMNGSATVGTSTTVARQDHIHPTDTSREPIITAGTTAQYLRGDKSLSTFATDALSAAPAETTTTTGALINGATAKTTPVDADYVGLMDSAASNILKKLSWANIKATLKTYLDAIYSPIAGPGSSQAFATGALTAGDKVITSSSFVSSGYSTTISANTAVLDASGGLRLMSVGPNPSTFIPIIFHQKTSDGSDYQDAGKFDASGNLALLGNTTINGYMWGKGGVYPSASGGSTTLISTASSGAGSATTYIGNAAINVVSDVRLKADITPTTINATDLINALEVVDHTWDDPSDICTNNRNSRGTWVGLKAQQAALVVPWVVNAPDRTCPTCLAGEPCEEHNHHEAPWRIEYDYLVPTLIKNLQESNARLDTLEQLLATYESRLAAQEARLNSLEAKSSIS